MHTSFGFIAARPKAFHNSLPFSVDASTHLLLSIFSGLNLNFRHYGASASVSMLMGKKNCFIFLFYVFIMLLML